MAKTLVIPVDDDLHTWVIKSKKEMGSASIADFIRTSLNYVRTTKIGEIKKEMVKIRLDTELKQVTEEATKLLARKEQLEQQMEKVLA